MSLIPTFRTKISAKTMKKNVYSKNGSKPII